MKLVTVLTMTFFLLLDGGRIKAFLYARPRPDAGRAPERIAEDVYRSVAGYVAGNLIISVCAGSVTWITLMALGVPFAVPWRCSWPSWT